MTSVLILLVLTHVMLECTESADCDGRILSPGTIEWQDNLAGSFVTVEWGLGRETCSSVGECFGLNLTKDVSLDPQMMPIQVQQGLTVRFMTSDSLDLPLFILPYRVDQAGFESCDPAGGEKVINEKTSDEFVVDSKFLQPGENYFISSTNDTIFSCEFGLRLNITVKTAACAGVGDPVLCWGHGRCAADLHQPTFVCHCCDGHKGRYCERPDACAAQPCLNNGTCTDTEEDSLGTHFRCQCPLGYYGHACEHQAVDLCETSPCLHSATCEGNSSAYTCHCGEGWTGTHCEVDADDCAGSPCVHGLCVDRVGGYTCYCKPGYTGHNCDQEYDECASSPCQNGGFCVDQEDTYRCHCTTGYTGTHCDLKVDLCRPSRCENATECIDYGHTFSCTCNPGFRGTHCEVNINECASSPCQHAGKCHDEVAGYRCVCARGFTGTHCEYLVQPVSAADPRGAGAAASPFHHPSRLAKLAAVAGTLAGALVLALGVLAFCYCRVHGLALPRPAAALRGRRQRGYVQHKDECVPEQRISSIEQSRLSADAIMEASSPRGYREAAPLSAPLVTSLKARRV